MSKRRQLVEDSLCYALYFIIAAVVTAVLFFTVSRYTNLLSADTNRQLRLIRQQATIHPDTLDKLIKYRQKYYTTTVKSDKVAIRKAIMDEMPLFRLEALPDDLRVFVEDVVMIPTNK